MVEHIKPKRSIKGVTTATATGSTLGAAIAQLLVHVFPYLEGTEAALTVIFTAILGLAAGWAVPPQEPEVITEYIEVEAPVEEVVEAEVVEEEDEPARVPGVGPVSAVQNYDMR